MLRRGSISPLKIRSNVGVIGLWKSKPQTFFEANRGTRNEDGTHESGAKAVDGIRPAFIGGAVAPRQHLCREFGVRNVLRIAGRSRGWEACPER